MKLNTFQLIEYGHHHCAITVTIAEPNSQFSGTTCIERRLRLSNYEVCTINS